jgi:hypothetical protein
MDAKEIAAEVETILTSAWSMWTKEAIATPNGLLLPPDFATRFIHDRAASIGIAFEGRIVPNESNMKADELFEQVQMSLDMVKDVDVIDGPERYSGVVQFRKSTIELLSCCAVTGDHRFAKVSALLYTLLERLNVLKEAYENTDPNQVTNDLFARH